MRERWKRCAGFPAYDVSSAGRVRQRATRRLVARWPDAYGYPSVSLKSGDRYLKPACHLLVWRTFRGAVPSGKTIDHRDRDRANPRLRNLRVATWPQQQANSRRARGIYSEYRGISWHKGRSCWVASIKDGPKKRHLGCFKTDRAAAAAYDKAAWASFGRFSNLNFPRRRA